MSVHDETWDRRWCEKCRQTYVYKTWGHTCKPKDLAKLKPVKEQHQELWEVGGAKVVNKDWGREIWIENNEQANYCGKILELNPGKGFSMHFHDIKVETFWILEGQGRLGLIDLKTGKYSDSLLYVNRIVKIPRLQPHQVINTGKEILKIVEFSTFHRDSDSYRVWRNKPEFV